MQRNVNKIPLNANKIASNAKWNPLSLRIKSVKSILICWKISPNKLKSGAKMRIAKPSALFLLDVGVSLCAPFCCAKQAPTTAHSIAFPMKSLLFLAGNRSATLRLQLRSFAYGSLACPTRGPLNCPARALCMHAYVALGNKPLVAIGNAPL